MRENISSLEDEIIIHKWLGVEKEATKRGWALVVSSRYEQKRSTPTKPSENHCMQMPEEMQVGIYLSGRLYAQPFPVIHYFNIVIRSTDPAPCLNES